MHTNREHDHHSFIHTWNTRYLLSKSCTCERMKIDCNTATFSFSCTCKRRLGESTLCVVWCNIVGDSLLSVIYHSAVCIEGWCWFGGGCTEIAEPSHISQRSGSQSSVVWHFCTDCWSGVACPCYLLPGSVLSVNQTTSKKLKRAILNLQDLMNSSRQAIFHKRW